MRYLYTLGLLAFFHQATWAQLMSGEQIVIDQRVDHDMYIAGGTVTINAPVHGDLVVAGGTIIINDTVTQDIMAAGGNIILNGMVGDDIRCAGGSIEIGRSVAGDLVITGGRYTIGKGAIISGNLLSSGGEVTLDGVVKGNITNASGVFTLNGTVEGNMDSRGGRIVVNGDVRGTSVMAADVIVLGDAAKFEGDVNYWNSAGTLDFKNSLQGGKATYDPDLQVDGSEWKLLGFASLLMLLWYLGASLVMILVIQYLFGTILKNAADTARNASLKSLGMGFLYLVATPAAVVILFVTLVGVFLGILTAIIYVMILLAATGIVSLVISNWINNTYYQSSWSNAKIAFIGFGIFVVLKLATLTPFVGPLVMLLLICMAFGSILLNVKWQKKITPVPA